MKLLLRKDNERKIELTALIDVIFLLLIFFLVTMNSASSFGEKGRREGTYGIAAMDNSHGAKGNAVVFIFQWPGVPQPRFIWIKGQRKPAGSIDCEEFCEKMNKSYSDGGHFDTFRADIRIFLDNFELEGRYEVSARNLTGQLQNVGRVIIVCPEEMQYGIVHEVIRACSEANISNFEIVPRHPFRDIFFNNELEIITPENSVTRIFH